MNSKKFALWLFIASIVMLFAALTSAYIVRRAQDGWFTFDIPAPFYGSTVILIFSSLTMYMGLKSARKNTLYHLKTCIIATFVLGLIFLYLQWKGWRALVSIGVYFSGNNTAGSFIYVLTGTHALHLISALIFILIILIRSFRKRIPIKNLVPIQVCNTYWHFLGGLWLYLFIFLLLNR